MKGKTVVKILAVLGCFAMSAGFVACGGKDNGGGGGNEGELVYTLNESGDAYSVVNCPNNVTKCVIPSVYNNLPVTSIGDEAFSDCDSLTKIVIPDSVTSIGRYAFYGCSSLTLYFEAEKNSSDWGYLRCPVVWDCNNNDIADDGCIYTVVDGVRYSLKDGIATVVRQPGNIAVAKILKTVANKGMTYDVTSIGDYAFCYCSSLTEIVIPDSVTSIGDRAFNDCKNLTKIALPDSIASIGEESFMNCKGLTEIIIPEGVTSIGSGIFEFCHGLTSIVVDEDNTSYKSMGGNLYSKDGMTLIQYAVGKTESSFTVPDSVTGIGASAFYGCKNLTELVIPDSVMSIGEHAFFACENLTEVTCPTIAIPTLDKSNLQRVVLTSGDSIGYRGFGGCEKLEEIVIPDGVTSIGWYAFSGCSSLTEIVIPNTVTSIGDSAFSDCSNLSEIVIPDSVTSIGDDLFENCSNLQYTIKGGLKYLGNSNNPYLYLADTETTEITVAIIEGGCKLIGPNAFSACSSLSEIVIPASVTSIGDEAFSGCDRLTIYCEAEGEPGGWSSWWNDSDCPVVWGYKGE